MLWKVAKAINFSSFKQFFPLPRVIKFINKARKRSLLFFIYFARAITLFSFALWFSPHSVLTVSLLLLQMCSVISPCTEEWAKDLCQYKRYNRVCQLEGASRYIVACVCKTQRRAAGAYVTRQIYTYGGDSQCFAISWFSTAMSDEFAQFLGNTRLTLSSTMYYTYVRRMYAYIDILYEYMPHNMHTCVCVCVCVWCVIEL